MECQVPSNDPKTVKEMKEYKYTIDGKEYKVAIGDIVENVAEVTVNGEQFKVEMEPEAEPEKKKVVLGQPAADSASDSDATASAANVNTANAVKAPLPGVVTKILVKEGQSLKKGDAIIVLEAMKMQSTVSAPEDCIVERVNCIENESIMANQELVKLKFGK